MFWVLLILLFFLLANAFDKKVPEVEMAPDQFAILVMEESINIDKLRIMVDGNEIQGTLLQEMSLPDVGSGIPFTAFRVVMPNSVINEQYPLWDEQGIPQREKLQELDIEWVAEEL